MLTENIWCLKMTKELNDIAAHFTKDQFTTDKAKLEKYGCDWYKGITPNAAAIIFPETEKDVLKLFKLCNQHSIRLVISGGRTGLSGGATAAHQEIVLSTERLNKVHWVDNSNQIVCQAGVVTDTAKALASSKNRILPIEFSSTSASTIGGNIATNAAGAKFIKYGATKKHVVGLKIIMVDGTILNLINRNEKDATGPDLMELFFGSEGVMGLIFEATLRTYELPEFKESILVKTNDLSEIHSVINEERNLISAVEFMDYNCLQLLEKESDYQYEVLIEFESSNQDVVDQALERIAAKDFDVSLLNARQLNEFWAARENLPVILADEGANKLDLCVPMNKIDLFLKKIRDYDTKNSIYNFGHLGDGNIHVNILLDESGALADRIYLLLQDFDGSPSAEHGIGKRKTKLLKKFTNYRDKLHLLKQLKSSVDPTNILGPKVFFED